MTNTNDEAGSMNESGVTRREFATFQTQISAGMVKLEAAMTAIVASVAELRPLLLERSGDRQEIEGMKRDLASSHDKHRTHFADREALKERIDRVETMAKEQLATTKTGIEDRISRIETRISRYQWTMLGAWAVVQVLFALALPILHAWVTAKLGLGH